MLNVTYLLSARAGFEPGSFIPKPNHPMVLIERKETNHCSELLSEEILSAVAALVDFWPPECDAA